MFAEPPLSVVDRLPTGGASQLVVIQVPLVAFQWMVAFW